MSTATENEIVRNIALVFLNNIAQATVFVFLYALAVLVFIASTYTILRKGLSASPTRVMFATTGLSFFLLSIYLSAFLSLFIIEVKYVFVAPSDTLRMLDVARLEAVAARTFAPEMVLIWSSLLPPIISDAIVIWRAWVLYTNQRWILVGPIVLLLASFVVSLTFNIYTSSYSGFITSKIAWSPCSFTWTNQNPLNYFLLAVALSFTTNLSATLLILRKLKEVPLLGHASTMDTSINTNQILAILVESGLIYCGFQAVFMVLVFIPSSRLSTLNTVYSVMFPLYLVFTTMYPSITVVLVGYERSLIEAFGNYGSSRRNVDVESSLGMEREAAVNLAFASFHSEDESDNNTQRGELGKDQADAERKYGPHTNTAPS